MKKRVLGCIMIAVMIVTMCSCGNNNEIELTLDNYSDYLDVSVSWYGTGEKYFLNNGLKITSNYEALVMVDSVGMSVEVSGVSTNFNYNDVTITLKIKGNYNCYDFLNIDGPEYTYDYESILTVDTNISGSGSNSDFIELSDHLVTHDYLISGEYEIIEISGTVTPVN